MNDSNELQTLALEPAFWQNPREVRSVIQELPEDVMLGIVYQTDSLINGFSLTRIFDNVEILDHTIRAVVARAHVFFDLSSKTVRFRTFPAQRSEPAEIPLPNNADVIFFGVETPDPIAHANYAREFKKFVLSHRPSWT